MRARLEFCKRGDLEGRRKTEDGMVEGAAVSAAASGVRHWQRHMHGERAALSRMGLDRDAAAVRQGDLFHDDNPSPVPPSLRLRALSAR